MQDRTIDNALLALRKQGGTQGKLAEVLLDMRGVQLPGWYQDRPFKRGDTKRMILSALGERSMTNSDLGKLVQSSLPDVTQSAAANRSYQALLRLEDKGLVVREGRVWRLTPPAANTPPSCG